jgi:large conductance mechanosensitive channel
MDFYEFLASYGILGFSVSTALGLSFYNIMDNIAGEIILPLIGALFGIKNLKDLHIIIFNQNVNVGKITQSVLSYLTILLIIFTLSYFFFYKLITNIHRVKKRHEQELLAEQTKTTTILQELKDLEEKKYNSIYKHQYV